MTVSEQTIAALREISTATLTIQMLKRWGMRTRAVTNVRPLAPTNCRFVGLATTLRYVPAREDLWDEAVLDSPTNPTKALIETMPPGGVLVIDMGGSMSGGALGDILVARLVARGVAGVVADGAMRDAGPLAAMSLPMFCRGFTAPPSFCGILAVQRDVPIGCGGVLVRPGDVVVADEDGPIVVPAHLADDLAQTGAEQERMEAWIKARVEAGASTRGLYPPDDAAMAEYRAAAARPITPSSN